MPTDAAAKRAYRNTLNRIIKRYRAREAATEREWRALLLAFRAQVADSILGTGTDFDIFVTDELTRNVDRLALELNQNMNLVLRPNETLTYQDGLESVVDPLNAMEIATYNLTISPSLAQVNALLGFSAELITDITDETRNKINEQIRLGALGGKSPRQVMQEITRILGFKGRTVVGGIAARAETIARTEINRAYNVAAQSQAEASLVDVPGMKKRWISTADGRTRETHLNAHIRYAANPIPVDEAFQVGSSELMQPLDPGGAASETINCRCSMELVTPTIGVVPSPLDAEVKQQKEERKDDK